MHYRLFVGEKWATVEKLFKDRTCHGTKRLCALEDQINAEDGTLRIGVELLETINEMDSKDYALRDADDDEPAGQEEAIDLPGLGSMVFHRHVNHRLVPQIRSEIERLGARLVRRVEWNVEQASKLRQFFQPRESLCSPAFACAGVEGMQLIFYPSGYSGATEGFCSFYLYCPAGVTLKAQLTVGNQVRDINHYYEESGAYGRANFCRYEPGIWDEKDDLIALSFQVSDVMQEQGSDGVHKASKDAQATSSCIKLLKVPAKESLVDTKVLPALWTSKGLGDLTTPEEGYEFFQNMGKTSAAQSANPFRPAGGIAGGGSKKPAAGRSESTPALRKAHATAPPPEPDAVTPRSGRSIPPSFATSPPGWPTNVPSADGGSAGSLPLLKPAGGRKGPAGGAGAPVVPLPPSTLRSANMSPLGSMNIPYVAGLT